MMLTPSAATWVRIRWRWNSGSTMVWAKNAGRIRSVRRHHRRSRRRRAARRTRGRSSGPCRARRRAARSARGAARSCAFQHVAHRAGVLDEPLVVEHRQRGEPRDHRELVLLEGGGVHERAVHRRVHRAEHVVAREHRGHRDVAARQRLGRADRGPGSTPNCSWHQNVPVRPMPVCTSSMHEQRAGLLARAARRCASTSRVPRRRPCPGSARR